MAKEKIHIMHASAQFSDSDAETREDFRKLFALEPHIISFTEMGSRGNLLMLRDVCRANDYHLYPAEAGNGLNGDDCCIAVRQGRNIKFRKGGTIRVHPGANNPEHLGGRYGPKNVSWVHAKFHNVDVFHHVAHWVHNQNEDALNRKRADMVSTMIGRQVRKHGIKGNVSFFAGDMNVDPDSKLFPRQIFREHKLITIWEDGGQRPTHGNRSIDVIGRYGADKRVEFTRYKVYNGYNSDHRPVSAWYEIDLAGRKPDPNDPPPGPGNDPDGEIVNAGNRSWKDYTDSEIYDLPQAVDDTDTFNG